MRVVRGVAALVLMAVVAVPAHAMNWSIGANLGYTRVMPDYPAPNDEAINSFSWPNSIDPTAGSMTPGIRVGFAGENPHHEFYFDTGLALFSTADFSARDFVVTGNYQYNFGSSGSVSPYVTLGGGVGIAGVKNETDPANVIDVSGTAGVYGVGLGIRHKMGNGHGTLRAEARFDRTTEATDGGFLIIPKSNSFGVKLGFDLWDK